MANHLDRMARVAQRVLKGTVLFLVTLVFVLVIRHGWDVKYLLLAGAALGCTALLRAPPSRQVNLTLLLVSTAIMMLLANFVLGLRDHTNQQFPRSHWQGHHDGTKLDPVLAQAARHHQVSFDPRSKLDVMMDLRRQGVEAWPSISPGHLWIGWPEMYRAPVLVIDDDPLLP